MEMTSSSRRRQRGGSKDFAVRKRADFLPPCCIRFYSLYYECGKWKGTDQHMHDIACETSVYRSGLYPDVSGKEVIDGNDFFIPSRGSAADPKDFAVRKRAGFLPPQLHPFLQQVL